MNPLFVIVEVFRWTPVPWFFPHRVFHVKILALICVIVALYLFIVWFCFYCTKRKKKLGLVNCELYSAVLIRLVVPSFPNNYWLRCLQVELWATNMGTCQMLGYHAMFLALNDSFSLFTSGFQYLNRIAIHSADDNASNFDWKNKLIWWRQGPRSVFST